MRRVVEKIKHPVNKGHLAQHGGKTERDCLILTTTKIPLFCYGIVFGIFSFQR